jgi:hypothetical protein
MEFGHSGVLSEGPFASTSSPSKANSVADGIHVDMDRLKKGEVK